MSEAATESSGDPRAIDPPFVASARDGCVHFDVFSNITYHCCPVNHRINSIGYNL